MKKRNYAKLIRRRGSSYLELLVCALITSVCLCGLVSLWYFSYNLTASSDRLGTAYTVGQEAIEEAKQIGFTNEVLGNSTIYCDSKGATESVTPLPADSYAVLTNITSDKMNGAVAASDALLTVTVTVSDATSGILLYQTVTYLARAGV